MVDDLKFQPLHFQFIITKWTSSSLCPATEGCLIENQTRAPSLALSPLAGRIDKEKGKEKKGCTAENPWPNSVGICLDFKLLKGMTQYVHLTGLRAVHLRQLIGLRASRWVYIQNGLGQSSDSTERLHPLYWQSCSVLQQPRYGIVFLVFSQVTILLPLCSSRDIQEASWKQPLHP